MKTTDRNAIARALGYAGYAEAPAPVRRNIDAQAREGSTIVLDDDETIVDVLAEGL